MRLVVKGLSEHAEKTLFSSWHSLIAGEMANVVVTLGPPLLPPGTRPYSIRPRTGLFLCCPVKAFLLEFVPARELSGEPHELGRLGVEAVLLAAIEYALLFLDHLKTMAAPLGLRGRCIVGAFAAGDQIGLICCSVGSAQQYKLR